MNSNGSLSKGICRQAHMRQPFPITGRCDAPAAMPPQQPSHMYAHQQGRSIWSAVCTTCCPTWCTIPVLLIRIYGTQHVQSHYDKAYTVAVRCANLIIFGSKYMFYRQDGIIHRCRADADAPDVPCADCHTVSLFIGCVCICMSCTQAGKFVIKM